MRIAKVPIDMTSEQKNLMGVVSTRQAIYLGIGSSILYAYVPPIFSFFYKLIGLTPSLIISLIAASPIIAIVVYLGFFKVEKFNMSRDYYLFIKFQRHTNVGLWRKGK